MRSQFWSPATDLDFDGWSEAELDLPDIEYVESRVGVSDDYIVLAVGNGFLFADRMKRRPPRLYPLPLFANNGTALGIWVSDSFALVSISWGTKGRNILLKLDLESLAVMAEVTLPEGECAWLLSPRRYDEGTALLYDANSSHGFLLCRGETLEVTHHLVGSQVYRCAVTSTTTGFVWTGNRIDRVDLTEHTLCKGFEVPPLDQGRWTAFCPTPDTKVYLAGFSMSRESYVLGAVDAGGRYQEIASIPFSDVHPQAILDRRRRGERYGEVTRLEVVAYIHQQQDGSLLLVLGGEGEWVPGDWGRCVACKVHLDSSQAPTFLVLSEEEGACFACGVGDDELAVHLERGRIAFLSVGR